jgi:hypothetical protein
MFRPGTSMNLHSRRRSRTLLCHSNAPAARRSGRTAHNEKLDRAAGAAFAVGAPPNWWFAAGVADSGSGPHGTYLIEVGEHRPTNDQACTTCTTRNGSWHNDSTASGVLYARLASGKTDLLSCGLWLASRCGCACRSSLRAEAAFAMRSWTCENAPGIQRSRLGRAGPPPYADRGGKVRANAHRTFSRLPDEEVG